MAEEYAVILCYQSDKTVTFTVGEEPTAYINDADVVIRSNNVEVRYPISNGVTFKIVKQESSNVKGSRTYKTQFNINNGILCCRGLQAGETISLYSVNGTMLKIAQANENGESSIELNHHKNTMIIVKTKTKNFKIITR